MDSVIKHAVLQNEDDDIILPFASEICDSVEKTAIASEAHPIDSWFFSVPVRRLCVATEDIDIGDNISPGTNGNCRLTTIEELMANASNLAEPMTAEDFEDAESLPDGIYPIESEDLTVISADMVKYDSSNTVEDKIESIEDELVNAGTMKYDPETDKILLWDGTQWVDWKTAGLKLNPVFANGVLSAFFSPLSVAYKEVVLIDTSSIYTYCRIESGIINMGLQGNGSGGRDVRLTFMFTQQLNFADLYATYHQIRIKGKTINSGNNNFADSLLFGICDANGNRLTQQSNSIGNGNASVTFNETAPIPSSGVGYIYVRFGRSNLGTDKLITYINGIEFEE